MSEPPDLQPNTPNDRDELREAEIKKLLISGRRDGRRRRAALAALEWVTATRHIAQSDLWKDATDAVLKSIPRDRDDLETVLWRPFSTYSETVFDRIAQSRIELLVSKFSVRPYVHWLQSTGVSAVVDEDICTPGGQLYATGEHILGVIGETRSHKQIDEARRAVCRMLTEYVGGPYTENLRKKLRAHLNGRIARWEGEAIDRTSNLKPSGARPIVAPTAAKPLEIALPRAGAGAVRKAAETASLQPNEFSRTVPGQQPGRRQRGRPQTIPDERKAEVVKLKASGGTNRSAAALLYETKYPTDQQKRNVSSILRHYKQKVERHNAHLGPPNLVEAPQK